MKKYRCLTDDYRGINGCKKGEVYNANHTCGAETNTVEDFTKVYPEDWELVEDDFVLPKNMKYKEIIGYLTPSNLWDSEIPKGSVYIKDKNSPGNYCWQDDLHAGYRIPSEIVETWEPVYKETKTLPEINGYKGEIIQLDKVVKYGCDQLSAKGIEEFLANKSIGINRKINSITLCSGVEITIDQLQQIVDYFKE